MSEIASAALRRLREELRAIVRETLALADSAALERRFDAQGTIVARLATGAAERATANALALRLSRWCDTMQSLLRRFALASAADIRRMTDDATLYVRLERETVSDTTEQRWRNAFGAELEEIATALESVLDTCDCAVRPLRREPRRYEVLDVCVELRPDGVHVAVTAAGMTRSARADAPPTQAETEEFLRAHALPLPGGSSQEPFAAFGAKLLGSLFGGELRAIYDEAVARASAAGATLLLRLRLHDAGYLASVPWELLHDGTTFLALRSDTAIVRLDPQRPAAGAAGRTEQLRLLVTISSPRGYRMIGGEHEERLLRAALAPLEILGLLQVDIAPDGTLDTMRRMLRNAAAAGRPYAAWHYVGHGEWSAEQQRAAIVLTSAAGDPHRIGEHELSALLSGQTAPRLVVLNGCDLGRGAIGEEPAVIAAFHRCGVPTVIAMQFRISDEAAMTFSEELYGAIAAGEDVLTAVTEARRALFSNAYGQEWATPVIFVNAQEPGAL